MRLSHIEALTLFSALTAVVLAIVSKNTPKEQVRYGAFVFLSFVAVAVVVGWIMYPLPL